MVTCQWMFDVFAPGYLVFVSEKFTQGGGAAGSELGPAGAANKTPVPSCRMASIPAGVSVVGWASSRVTTNATILETTASSGPRYNLSITIEAVHCPDIAMPTHRIPNMCTAQMGPLHRSSRHLRPGNQAHLQRLQGTGEYLNYWFVVSGTLALPIHAHSNFQIAPRTPGFFATRDETTTGWSPV